MHSTRAPLALLALLTLLTSGCSLFTSQGPPPPEVKALRGAAQAEAARMQELHALVTRDLDEISTLQAAFFAVKPERWRAPFPLDHFKLVAMSCLNEPPADDPNLPAQIEGDAVREAIAARYEVRLGCAPATLATLWNSVQAEDQHARFAIIQLARVDRIRELRSRLHWRINQLPAVIQGELATLASQRAEWRRVRDEVQRNQPDYKADTRAEANRRLAAYEADLTGLQDAIKTVEAALPAWLDELQHRLSSFTLAITVLTAPAPL
jgi:hypothetical protein